MTLDIRIEQQPPLHALEIDWQQMRHCGPLKMVWQMLTSKQPMRIGMAVEAPVEANDLELANYTMENYINDPTTVANEDIETLILIPVIGTQ